MTSRTSEIALADSFDAAQRDDWLKLVDKVLKGGDFEKRLVSRTSDGVAIAPLYTRDDALEGVQSEIPGAAPFTRGSAIETGGVAWDIRQLHANPDPKSVNVAILEDLAGGVTSILLQASRNGGDAFGIPATKEDFGQALDNVHLDICALALHAGEGFREAAEALDAVWTARGLGPDKQRGALNADPIGTLALNGGLDDTPDVALFRAIELLGTTIDRPGVTALMANGHPFHAAGASEAQELAAMLSSIVVYLRSAEIAGIGPDKALPKIAIGLAADQDQFLTIAKLRAARRLVWRVADACGAGEAGGQVHMTATTAWRMFSKRDPWVNMLRTTIACSGAALGGADAICVLPFTWALGRPDAFARRIARNTHHVLMEESSLGKVGDPAGGSWYVEKLTDDLAREAWVEFQNMESNGGIVAVLEDGSLKEKIEVVAAKRMASVAQGRDVLTGVSAFPMLADDGVNVEPHPEQQSRTPAFSIPKLSIQRLAEPFESLRDAADAFAAKSGALPQVFLASLGRIADHTQRTMWIKNYLAAGGIEAMTSDGYANAEEASNAFKKSGAAIACISSSDALYGQHGAETAKALRDAGAKTLLLAGRPGDLEDDLRAAGVDEFLYAGKDALAALGDLHKRLGVSENASG